MNRLSRLLFTTAFAFVAISFGQNGVDTLVVAINNAPWLPGFEAIAKQYEEDTGITIELRVFPMDQLTERTRSATTASLSEFDVITMNTAGSAQFYAGGLVMPFAEIDPDFDLDPQIIEYAYATRWDEAAGGNAPDAPVYGIPINGNIQIFYYRCDLYEEAGLPAPETWQDVIAAADAIAGPRADLHGYAVRGQRGAGGSSVSWDFYPVLVGHGGRIFADDPHDWTVSLNSPEALEALELYVRLAKDYSPPNVASIGQADQIALLQAGRLLQTVVVAGAFANVDDPNASEVVGNICYTVVPRPVDGVHATATGELLQGIPRNIPAERQQAALEFLEYVVSYENQIAFARAGGVPIRSDVYESELADSPEFRYFGAMQASEPHQVSLPRIPESVQVGEVLERRLNEAVAGLLSPAEALELSAREIHQIMEDAGYATGLR